MKEYVFLIWQVLWSSSSKTWVKNENLPKKVLHAIRSGSVYNNVKKDRREFGQRLSVLEECLENKHDGGSDVLKRLL